MAGGKGGSTTSTIEVPVYIEEAARRNLAKAEGISQIGFAVLRAGCRRVYAVSAGRVSANR